jgi:hypothetical protein
MSSKNCEMCSEESRFGTEEVPHPIDPRLHTCIADGVCLMCELEKRIRTKTIPFPIDIRLHSCPVDASDPRDVWPDEPRVKGMQIRCKATSKGMRCNKDDQHGLRRFAMYDPLESHTAPHVHVDSRGRVASWTDAECDPGFRPSWARISFDGGVTFYGVFHLTDVWFRGMRDWSNLVWAVRNKLADVRFLEGMSLNQAEAIVRASMGEIVTHPTDEESRRTIIHRSMRLFDGDIVFR